MTSLLPSDFQDKLSLLNKWEEQGKWEEIENFCHALALDHHADLAKSLATVRSMSRSGGSDYARIYVDRLLSLQPDRNQHIADLIAKLATENLEAQAYLYLLDAIKRRPEDIRLRKMASDLSLYLGYLDEAYHWTASLAFFKPMPNVKARRNRLDLFLKKRAPTHPFQLLAGTVYSRSSAQAFNTEDPPGERELMTLNPLREKFLKDISGWESVYAGSLNLYTTNPPHEINQRISAVAYEAGVDVNYPDAHASVPKERFGYWYYTGFLFFSGKIAQVLFRYPDFRKDSLVLEVFSSEKLRTTLELSDGDRVLCYFSSEKEQSDEWLKCKLEIYSVFARNQQAFGRHGELYQAHEEWKLPGQRPTLSRIESYNLQRWILPEDHILDIGCNIGCFGIETAKFASSYTGFDNNPDLITIATCLARYKNTENCTFLTSDFEKFRLANDRKFNIIFSFAVHVWIGIPMREYIQQLKEMLAPAGTVIIESNNLDTNDLSFMENMQEFLKADFMLLHQGELTDDGVIRRAFCVFKALQ